MGLSSNTLFHFTIQIDFLKGIISQGFKMSYCLEENNAFPMISFCDLPLSSISEQLDKYGNYSLGMTLDWGIRNKLNPIMYFQDNSELSDSYNNAYNRELWRIKQALDEGKNPHIVTKETEHHFQLMLETERFKKPYSADLERGDTIYKNYKFYDEREWRYVPSIKSTDIQIQMPKEDYLVYKKTNNKPHFHDNPLVFNSSDIKYIILKSESEISEFIDFLRKQKKLFINKNDIDILITKIITAEYLKEDL